MESRGLAGGGVDHGIAHGGLVAAAGFTGLDILVDKLSHARPVVVACKEFEGFLLALMSRCLGIMM